ncbi:DUF6049 family protein [Actinophytocola gossypii]|uniref:Glycoprotein n=1 Tax=Actinophytocola gossypii TaxID=2812003 RepID=A0ABT2JGE6_9PSEU|nr:DUF6049 family protein [Actinophytocola gossypii]MCT2586510.1 hypothetical protein [Actinophytocola gossypii]
MTFPRTAGGLLATALLLLAPVAPAAANPIGDQVPPSGGEKLLRLEVTTMSPRVITADTTRLTVTGRVTNVGDRAVDDVEAKVQRGEPLERDADLQELADHATDSATSPFVEVADTLEPGDSAELTVTANVRGTEQSLALNSPGVYPLLVNVNGRPDYGGQARLAAVSIPLPVLSIPGGGTASPEAELPGVSIVWPILGTQPRRLPTTDGSTVLTDDALADALAPDGRLFGLVNSVAEATAGNGTLLNSLCFAIDPDLLRTVSDMTGGYQVRTETGRLVPGEGANAASDWLTRLSDLTRGRCVFAVPYADADLAALSRSGAVELAQLSAGSSVVADVLAPVQPVSELFWPAGGSFDQRTLVDLATVGPTTVLADPAHLQGVTGRAPYAVTGTTTTHPVRALPVDPLVSNALDVGRGGPGVDRSLQNGLAALAFRTLFDGRPGGEVLVTPPRRWMASATELRGYLDFAQRLFDGGYAEPRSLAGTVSGPNRGTVGGLAYTPRDSAQEIPASITADVARINQVKRDLLDAMNDDNTNDVDPNTLLSPLQYGLLRGTSTAWRGSHRKAAALVAEVDEQLEALCDQVVINDPQQPLTLASGDSPIPVTLSNGLPVSIEVRVRLAAQPGLTPQPFQDVLLPPQSARTVLPQAEASRAGRFKVDVSLSTPGGTQLGSTEQLEVSSSSYGVITIALTGTAGGILIVLVAFRIFRRVRAARAGEAVDPTGPEPIVEDGDRVDP